MTKKHITQTAALVTGTGAHATGDLVGTKMTFDLSSLRDVGPVYLRQAMVRDLAAQDHDHDLILFGADPSGTTFTDDAAFDIADADLAKVIGIVKIADYFAFADNGVACKTDLAVPLPLDPAGDHKIYAALVTRGTPTYGANDVSVALTFGL